MTEGGEAGERILLLLEQRENRRLLREMLTREFRVAEACEQSDLDLPFDLLISDGAMLDRHWERVVERRRTEETVFLPVLLITGRHDIGFITRHLWRSCDEIIFTPIEKTELRARLEILLRARRYSLQAEARYYTLAESSPVGVFLQRNGRAVWANPALAKLLHCSGEDLRSTPLIDRFDPEDRRAVRNCLARVEAGEKEGGLTVRLLTPAGLRWGELHAVSLPHQKESTILGLLADVTRARESERLKNAFLSTAAHELNTPVTAILGFSELLLQDPELSPHLRELLEPIHHKAEGLARIVHDLLHLSRIQAGGSLELERAPGELGQAVTGIVEDFRREFPGRLFTAESPPEGIQIEADWEKLSMALRNLLSNAVKFSPNGSRIRVRVAREEELCRLRIEDEGAGMSSEQVKDAREIFYRADTSNTAPEGFGMGLAVARSIVAAHGGALELESSSGEGTRVTITLPAGKRE